MLMGMRMRLHLNHSSATTAFFYFIFHIEFQCKMFFLAARMRLCPCVLFFILFHTFPYFSILSILRSGPDHSITELCIYVFRVLQAPSSIWPKQGCLATLEVLGFSIRQVGSILRPRLISNPQTHQQPQLILRTLNFSHRKKINRTLQVVFLKYILKHNYCKTIKKANVYILKKLIVED